MKKNINIFYSWQSDLDRDTNENAIRIEIKKAIPIVEEQLGEFNLSIDEATRNISGSPEIPLEILKKINNCDIFICDLTTINFSSDNDRKVPNPNVVFELGYAVSILGWERIIMLFNQKYGDFKSELPFDFEKRRVLGYNIDDKTDASGKGNLRNKIKDNLELILTYAPQKPFEKIVKTPNEFRREKDVENLRELLSNIHFPTFDSFLHYLPNRIIDKIFFFYYGVQEIVESSSFHIYDQDLNGKIFDFVSTWEKTLNHSSIFITDSSGNHLLYVPFDTFQNRKDEEEFGILVDETLALKKNFEILIKNIRENYLEIDVDYLSKIAGERYKDYHEEKK